MQPREGIGSRCAAAMQGLGPGCPPARNLTLTVFPAVVNLPLPPKTGEGFWTPRGRWAEGEIPAHLPSPGKAKNAPCRAATAQRSGLEVAGIRAPRRSAAGCMWPPKSAKMPRLGSRRFRKGSSFPMSFPHDARATPAERGEHDQPGGAPSLRANSAPPERRRWPLPRAANPPLSCPPISRPPMRRGQSLGASPRGQILPRSSAAGKHRNRRQDLNRKTSTECRAAEADRARIFAIKRQPPLRGDWSLAAGLNGGIVRGERPPSAKARHRLQPIKRVSLFRVAPFFRADVGVHIGMVVDRGGDLDTVGMRRYTEGR